MNLNDGHGGDTDDDETNALAGGLRAALRSFAKGRRSDLRALKRPGGPALPKKLPPLAKLPAAPRLPAAEFSDG
jgi:hypothetical protein